jgi:RNA polymerase sigma-70 factor (ECF subfamily)
MPAATKVHPSLCWFAVQARNNEVFAWGNIKVVTFSNQAVRDYVICDPDVRLMLAVADDDTSAFEQLWSRYHNDVGSVIEHLIGNRRYTDDLVQEVFLRVYRARKTYVPTAKFSTWLYCIVNNVVSNTRRSLSRRREVGISAIDHAEPLDIVRRKAGSDCPSQPLERDELCSAVHGAIAELNERQRTAVTLCHLDGLSYNDVGTAMNTSSKAIKSLLARARDNLRDKLTPYAAQSVYA